MPFDDDDKVLLTEIIDRAFRAQRMGNNAYRNVQLNLIETLYGKPLRKRVMRTLREDRNYIGKVAI